MAMGHIFAHGRRRQADAVFVLLDFLGDTDAHDRFLCVADGPFGPGLARNLAGAAAQVPVHFAV